MTFKIGQQVKYFPIQGRPDYSIETVNSEPWVMENGLEVIKLQGKAGCFATSHLKTIEIKSEATDMQQVTDKVTEIMNEMNQSGKLDELITKNVSKCIEEAVESAFGKYGDFSKKLDKALSEAINFDFKDVSLPAYNEVIFDAIGQVTVEHLREQAEKTYLERLSKLLSPAPKEITMQEIVNLYIEAAKEGYDQSESHLTVEIEESEHEWWTVKIFEGHGRSYSSTKVEFTIHKDKRVRGFHDSHRGLGTYLFNADAKLYQMYAAGTIVTDIDTVDVDDLETYIDYGY